MLIAVNCFYYKSYQEVHKTAFTGNWREVLCFDSWISTTNTNCFKCTLVCFDAEIWRTKKNSHSGGYSGFKATFCRFFFHPCIISYCLQVSSALSAAFPLCKTEDLYFIYLHPIVVHFIKLLNRQWMHNLYLS